MSKTYRFDQDLAIDEQPAILAWCHANGIVPEDTPITATVVIDDLWITIDQFVRGENGRILLDVDRDDIMRTTRVVPLIAKPELASLKPVKPSGGSDAH